MNHAQRLVSRCQHLRSRTEKLDLAMFDKNLCRVVLKKERLNELCTSASSP